jgi:hypothetical protein
LTVSIERKQNADKYKEKLKIQAVPKTFGISKKIINLAD